MWKILGGKAPKCFSKCIVFRDFSSSTEYFLFLETAWHVWLLLLSRQWRKALWRERAARMTKRCDWGIFSRGFTLAFTWPPSGSRVSEVHPDGRVGARQSGCALSVSWHINTNNTCSRWLGRLTEAWPIHMHTHMGREGRSLCSRLWSTGQCTMMDCIWLFWHKMISHYLSYDEEQ